MCQYVDPAAVDAIELSEWEDAFARARQSFQADQVENKVCGLIEDLVMLELTF